MCCQLDYGNFFPAKNENQGLSLTEIFRYLMYRKDDVLKKPPGGKEIQL